MRYVSLVLLLGACAGPTVVSTPNSCSSLIPEAWINGIPAPPLPDDDTAGSWISFGDSAIGKLDQANGRQRDTMEIQRKCEARDLKAVQKSTRPWWKIL